MTESSTRTRQEIYDRIRQSSREEFILEEMIRLGFWPSEKEAPTVPGQVIRREGELTRELNELLKKQRRFQNRELMLREMRKQRMADSRRRQAETKARREQERLEKAERWKKFKEKEIFWLGRDVSGGLNSIDSNREKLAQNGLPVFEDAASLAGAMAISVGELRFLSFSRKTATVSHYQRFAIPKKRGGHRLISAPMPRLKAAQYFVLNEILSKVPCHEAAHGFLANHSILTNAAPHVGKEVVINLDLKDFFPTITYPRVKGLFRSLGYAEKTATILGLICTEPEVDEVELDGNTYFVGKSERYLPQGAPTSPAISNLIFRNADRRLNAFAEKQGFVYTRYADDLTFSTSDADLAINKLLWHVQRIVVDEGFVLHPEKQRIMRKGARQEVTGIVVNEKMGISRPVLRKFRALLFQIEKDGFEGKEWNGSGGNLSATIWGFAHYVAMVNPEKGRQLVKKVEQLLDIHNLKASVLPTQKPVVSGEKQTEIELNDEKETFEKKEKKPWWKLW